MILLDTNVVSEPIRRHPDRRVLEWLDAQAIETLYFSTISLGELLLGVENLPVGRRRTALTAAMEQQIADCSAIASCHSTLLPPRPMQNSSPARAGEDIRFRSQMVKLRASPPPTNCVSPRATNCRFMRPDWL
jgi:predicted nucleic acid-binding protein